MPELEPIMPIKGLIAAWREHYIAKGCSPLKAGHLAWKKRNKTGFPPIPSIATRTYEYGEWGDKLISKHRNNIDG